MATAFFDFYNRQKAIILSVSKGSAGSVPVSGKINTSGNVTIGGYTAGATIRSYLAHGISVEGNGSTSSPVNSATYPATINQSGSITPSGAVDLTTKLYSAQLISETQIQSDGAVEWQVIEFR